MVGKLIAPVPCVCRLPLGGAREGRGRTEVGGKQPIQTSLYQLHLQEQVK